MPNQPGANVDCLLVSEYIDEAELPANPSFHYGEVVRPQNVAQFVDLWSKDDSEKEFKVLLSDQRVVTVRGHSLTLIQNAANPQDLGSYGIVLRVGNQELLVALFRVGEVKGVFNGDLAAPATA